MTDKLNAALQELQHAISANAPAPIVIDSGVLETSFHGLTLRQLVLLTQTPVLAVHDFRRLADGARVEQFSIDGKDEDRCELAARDLILAGQTEGSPGIVREVRINREGSPEHSFVVDRNDIVYRVTDGETVVDRDLTAELRGRRQSAGASDQPSSPTAQDPVIINDSFGFRGIAGQVLHGLAAVRARNGIAIRAIGKLVSSSGEQSLETACQVANPEAFLATFRQIINASQQIDALLEAIGQRTRMLLSLVEPSVAKPVGRGREGVADEQIAVAPNPGFSIESVQSAKV